MDYLNLNSFLRFGYFLNYRKSEVNHDFSILDKNRLLGLDEEELLRLGADLWIKAVDKQFISNEKNTVPLSGGLDSRAILASLLLFTEARNITTYTFGVPGTLDYEIGNSIGRVAGTRHIPLNLKKYIYCLNDLIDISKRVDHQTLLFLHPDIQDLDRRFKESNIWTGTIIDVYFGRHHHKLKANNWLDAARNSIKENIFVNSIKLTNIDDDSFIPLIDYDAKYENVLEREYIIDLMNRQVKFIAPHVLIKGFNYKTMLDNDLKAFALSLDQKYLEKQYLYKKIFQFAFKNLFKYGTKSNFGLPLDASAFRIYIKKKQYGLMNKMRTIFPWLINPFINYLDFEYEIRENSSLNKVVYNSIMELKARKIIDWIDFDKIWNDHINKKKNYADALLILSSLEIHLKAGKIL